MSSHPMESKCKLNFLSVAQKDDTEFFVKELVMPALHNSHQELFIKIDPKGINTIFTTLKSYFY